MGCIASKPDNGFPMHHLPTELLVKILFQLDGYSLNNVFEASPTIAKRFFLITNCPQTAVFTCTSLRRVELHDFKKGSFRAYLKVFEIRTDKFMCRCCDYWTDFKGCSLEPFYSSLDAYCFVHLANPLIGSLMLGIRYMMNRFMLTGATAETNNCTAGTILSNPSSRQIREVCESGVTSLIIKDVSVVKSFKPSKNLQFLTIIFNASSKTPRIEALEFCRSVKYFTVVLYGKFPIIDSFIVRNRLQTERGLSILEFTNAVSMMTQNGTLPPNLEHCYLKNRYACMTTQPHDSYGIFRTAFNFGLTNFIGDFSEL